MLSIKEFILILFGKDDDIEKLLKFTDILMCLVLPPALIILILAFILCCIDIFRGFL